MRATSVLLGISNLVALSVPARASSLRPYQELKLAELEALEYERPLDLELKMELGRQYWCQGTSGLAHEHWIWVERESRKTLLEATQYRKRASEEPEKLKRELCESYPQQMFKRKKNEPDS